MKLSHGRLSIALSVTALTVALFGATPVGNALVEAVVPRNSVGTPQLKNAAVTSAKLAPNAVTSAKVRDGSLLAADFKAGQLPKGEKGDRGDPGPSDAFSIAKKGPVGFQRFQTVTVATLPIPQAGKYVVSAKLWVFDLVPSAAQVACQLSAGETSDFARASLTGVNTDQVTYATPALQLTHDFTAPGSVTLSCAEFGGGASTVVSANDIVITAIRVGSLTQTRE